VFKSIVSNIEGFRRLKQIECADATAAFTTGAPLVLSKAKGCFVWDVEGTRYVDLCAGFGALALGHNPPEVASIFERFLGNNPPPFHGMGDIYPSQAKIALLECLSNVLPARYSKISLSISGAGAVDTAIKSALLATGRSGIICFEGGYHGLELGLLPLVGREDFREPFASWNNAPVVRLPRDCSREEFLRGVKELESKGTPLAAIIIEPVGGRSGVRLPTDGWLEMICTLTHESGGLVIFDEILTGMGRTGKLAWAEEYDCDLVCLGKALGGGVAISACIGTEAAMSGWPRDNEEAIHTGTFFGHPFSCEIALRVVQTIVSNGLVERAATLGLKAKEHLEARLKGKAEVRTSGLLIAIDLGTPGAAVTAMESLKDRKILAIPSGHQGEALSLTPALNIPEDIFLTALDHIVDCIWS
jgi:4-aminobutyrate aminotransferase/(S)-3-amino-2-methylpropionate transaminase